jgi:hypothetical protein
MYYVIILSTNKSNEGEINMSRPTNKVIRDSQKKIYDTVGIVIRKDSTFNKEYILKHIDDNGSKYKSMNDFIIQAIYNQIENDLTTNDK